MELLQGFVRKSSQGIEVDGSKGEGGGQVVRTALALAAIKGERITITNIRAGRSTPGLRAQHRGAARLLRAYRGGTLQGDAVGSTTLVYDPGEERNTELRADLGTAGSITLAMQALLPVLAHDRVGFAVTLKGGTDVAWSPPYDHFENVFLRVLAREGFQVRSECQRRGFYPKGGGEVRIWRAQRHGVGATSHLVACPRDDRQRQRLEAWSQAHQIPYTQVRSPSAGAVLTTWDHADIPQGRAELIGKGQDPDQVWADLRRDLATWRPWQLDPYSLDQFIPYLFLMGRGSRTTHSLTKHAMTNAALCSQILDVEWDYVNDDPGVTIELF